MAKTGKDLAQRIDPSYYRRRHPFRSTRALVSLCCTLAAAAWAAFLTAGVNRRAFAAGPVAESHALFERDCQRCHAGPFEAVEDDSCRTCHRTTAHAPPEKPPDPRCIFCHGEHRGRQHLDVVSDEHCNGCHAEHKGIVDFAGHPPFETKAPDQALRFPHDKHLRPDLKGGPIGCAACHRPDRAGEEFQPISFEASCVRCHMLGFDPAFPEARAPHGLEEGELQLRVEAFYVGALRALPEPAGAPRHPVPGRAPLEPPDWVRVVAERSDAALRVLAKACTQCHTQPVRKPAIPERWWPSVRFPHATHGFEACTRCHAAASSRESADVLLPPAEVCRACHHESGAPTSCAPCHPFHRRWQPPPATGTNR